MKHNGWPRNCVFDSKRIRIQDIQLPSEAAIALKFIEKGIFGDIGWYYINICNLNFSNSMETSAR